MSITDHAFLPVAGHPDDDECTNRSDGTDDTYCGLPEHEHVVTPTTDPVTGQQIDRDQLRELADEYDDSTIDGGPDMAAGAIRQLLDMLDQAEQRIRDLTQEARDERAACLDQIEQVQARDARIQAVEDVLEEPDAMIGAHTHVSVTRIRRALDGEQ